MSDLKQTKPGLPCAGAELVPHRNAMLFLDYFTDYTENSGAAEVKISPDNIFLRNDGSLDPVVLAEVLAQVTAAHSGYEAKIKKEAPKDGFLVGIKPFRFFEIVRSGDLLQIDIMRDMQFDKVSYVTGSVRSDGRKLAEGTLKLWESEHDESDIGLPIPQPVPRKTNPDLDEKQQNIIKKSALNAAILNNCYRFEADESQAVLDFYFDPSFEGFNGHFPQQAILPGVMMLKSGFLAGSLLAKKELKLLKIKTAKFARTVFPQEPVELAIDLKQGDENNFTINARFLREKELCAKFTLEAMAADE